MKRRQPGHPASQQSISQMHGAAYKQNRVSKRRRIHKTSSLHLNNFSNKWKASVPSLLIYCFTLGTSARQFLYINDPWGSGQRQWPRRALDDDTCTGFSVDGSYVPDSINFANILVHRPRARPPVRCCGICYFLTSHSERHERGQSSAGEGRTWGAGRRWGQGETGGVLQDTSSWSWA